MTRASSTAHEPSRFDRTPLARRRRRDRGLDAVVDRGLFRGILAALSLLFVSVVTVAVFPGGGLALSLIGFGILLALPFAIVWAVAGSLHPAQ